MSRQPTTPKRPKRKSVGYISKKIDQTKKARRALSFDQHPHPPSLPPAYDYSEDDFEDQLNIGEMDIFCQSCSARKFSCERPGMCCNNGNTQLEALPEWPQCLQNLLQVETSAHKHFMQNIRKYNNIFQMTSFGCQQRQLPGWNPTFTVYGQVFHRIGTMDPPTDRPPQFLQIYFIDNVENELTTRMGILDGLNPDIVRQLNDMLHINNKYVRMLKNSHEILKEKGDHQLRVVIHEDKRPRNEHAGRYNAPTSDEIGILMPNEPTHNRDIIIHQRDGCLQRISELHRSYDPLQYPLLFPHGTDGYSIYLQNSASRSRKITQLQYYAYHIQMRAGNHLVQSGRLFQQFLVDVYCKIETERLGFLRREQKTLRADTYQNLRDSIVGNDSDPRQLGQRVILPSSYIGGPRYMHERQQDAISYVTRYGRPQLFITSTTNPKWNELLSNLLPGQSANDIPVLATRVFNLKKNRLMSLLKEGACGTVAAWLYSVEFQKRGLPHVHILVWLTPDSKIHPDNIDRLISAEIPCPTAEPELFSLVRNHMIHGPCGAFRPNSPCMQDRKCKKNFPKQFREETEYGNDGYPKYKRRSPEQGGNTILTTKVVNGEKITEEVDNRFVVPYNKWLLRQMGCHTNVEVCSSVKAIKYVLKYVNKGADQAIFSIQLQDKNDEILMYQEARYVGSMEAAHRLLGFPIHEHWPPVMQLSVHLENGQRVYFTPEDAKVRAQAQPPKTTLTEFMRLCETDTFARTLLYHQVPTYYTWSKKTWLKRKQGTLLPQHPGVRKAAMLGRVYTIHPNLSECFHLRMLLHVVTGPVSFQFLREFEGAKFTTYREVCLARGLLANDEHLSLALSESCDSDCPSQIRHLFAIIVGSCDPADPMALWEKFKEPMSEDIARTQNVESPYSDSVYQRSLAVIQEILLLSTGKYLASYGLPVVQNLAAEADSVEYRRHKDYALDEQHAYLDSNLQKMNQEQRSVFENFRQRIDDQSEGILFLDAPGGTGKTFLINLILASVRSEGSIIIACASSGIAATLLTGGRTIHSTLKVPLDLHLKDEPTCSIKRGTALARVLNETRAIVIDEAPMTHRKAYEAIDRSLRDIRQSDKPFGGIPVLLCGDFRQILPVVRHGTRPIIVDATLKKSYLWRHTETVRLTTNMRVHLLNDSDAQEYSGYLREVGDGLTTVVEEPDYISMTDFSSAIDTPALIKMVYPDIEIHFSEPGYFLDKAILAPLNDTVNSINQAIIEQFPGESMTYTSINSTMSPDDAVHYPPEFLNSIELSGVPPHSMTLKIGCPVILMRSLDPPHLTNGTRCIVKKLYRNVIEVMLLHGPPEQNLKFIPRIPIIPSDSDLPFQFKRIQFPLKPCFALTINKSQGQTFKSIGLCLQTPIFTHGMLYVALSRVGDRRRVTVLSSEGLTRNVVYKEVLQ